jgi:ankyrin repeat protein
MPISSSAAGFAQRVLDLGPDYSLYGAALNEKKTVDSPFLQNLTDREASMMFAFIPQAHQVKLERLFPQNANTTNDAPVEKAAETLAWNSDDEDEFPPETNSVQFGISHDFEDCGDGSWGDELFLDLDKSDDELLLPTTEDEILPETNSVQSGTSHDFEDSGDGSWVDELFLDLDKSDDELLLPTTAAKKRKRKKRRKKKTAAKKSNEELDTIADLDNWLSKGAPLTFRKALRTDLLIRAAMVGHIEAIKVLLEKPGIRVLLQLPLGPCNTMASALHVAAYHGHSGVVRLLLAKPGTQINRAMADVGSTSLHLASSQGHSEVVKILLHAGADKNARDSCGYTSLCGASQEGRLEVVKILLDAGADKDAPTPDGFTPLYNASQEGHTDLVKVLLDAGVEKEAMATDGRTPLYIAAQEGHSEVLQILLDAGADKEARTQDGLTSLVAATLRCLTPTRAHKGNVEVLRILLNAGADQKGQLIVAAQLGNVEVVRILLNAGADKKIIEVALVSARKRGHFEVEKALFDKRWPLIRSRRSELNEMAKALVGDGFPVH